MEQDEITREESELYAWAADAEQPEEELEPTPFDDFDTPEPVQAASTEIRLPAAKSDARYITLVDPRTLKAHPRNREVYGQPETPKDLIDSIAQGWSATSILEALPDGTLIKGHLRRDAAVILHLQEVPVIFRADLTDDEAAQVEELLRDNAGRVKTRETICREWRLALETFRAEHGTATGEKTRDMVGKWFGVSGVTLEHGVQVVNFVDNRAQDIELRGKVAQVLNARGVEPAWKLLRRQDKAVAAPGEAEETPGESEGTTALLAPAKRVKALGDVLSYISDRSELLADVDELVAALPAEQLDDTLSAVQISLALLGLIESEIRDRLEAPKPRRRKKAGA